MKEIIEFLEKSITQNMKRGVALNAASWGSKEGVLITTFAAKQIVDALKRLPDESKLLKYAVVFTAEDKQGNTVVANCYIDVLKEPIDPLKYFAQKIEDSNDIFNVVVTFFIKVN